ncbi:T9SS type A sorting domain-containing protein [Raineya sp.]
MLKYLLFGGFLLLGVWGTGLAQPSNDNCVNALPIAINAICTNGQTNTATSEALDAGGCTSANSRTVWYSFTATQTTHYILADVISAGLDVAFAVYSGSCGSLTKLFCIDAGSTDIDEQTTYSSFVVGQTYLLRVSAYGTTNGNFCVSVRGAPPNDACSNAVALTPNGNPILGTNILATNDGSTTCLNTARSVWYQFTATHTTHRIELDILTTTANLGFRLFQGSCGSLTPVLGTCTEEANGAGIDEAYTYTSLTVGQTYRIMVSSAPATTHEDWFYIKVIAPPANDAFANATILTINADCTPGNNHLANSDGTSSCLSTARTVWYRFTATHTNHFIELIPAGHSTAYLGNLGFTFYTSGLTEINCTNNFSSGSATESRWVTGLTIGNIYYISVSGASATDRADFCIRVASPPANDACLNARDIEVDKPGIFGTNVFATNDGSITCGSPNRSVWYKFIATKTNHLVIVHPLTTSTTNTDLALAIYSGSCGSLTQINCTNQYSNAKGEMAILSGLSIGATYYVMVTGYTANDQAPFSIAVMSNNDACANRNTVEINKGWVLGAVQGMAADPITFCSANTASNNTVWFSFIATASNVTVEVEPDAGNPSGTGNQRGLDVEFNVYHNSSGVCGITFLNCRDNLGYGGAESLNLTGLTIGATYLIAVDGEFDGFESRGSFRVRVTTIPPCGANPAPANTCSAAPVISNLNGYCGVTSVSYNPNFYNNLNNLSQTFCSASASIENNSFLQFVAGDIQATFEWAITSNAPNGGPPCDQGIQIQIYEVIGTDCETGIWKPISSCPDPTGPVGSSGSITVTGLTPGKTYYIMFDGFAGDECGYRISIPENSGVVLPVEFLSFRAKREKPYNRLMWQTAQEINLNYFEIQWSKDGSTFVSLDRVPAQNKAALYTYEHKAIEFGHYYYRLRIVEKDGKQSFSPVESVYIKPYNDLEVSFYPTPFKEKGTLECFAPENLEATMQVFNMEGVKLFEKQLSLQEGKNEFEQNFEYLAKGIYLLKVTASNGEQKTIRIVKNE